MNITENIKLFFYLINFFLFTISSGLCHYCDSSDARLSQSCDALCKSGALNSQTNLDQANLEALLHYSCFQYFTLHKAEPKIVPVLQSPYGRGKQACAQASS